METVRINVVNVIGDVFGVEADDGQKVFDLIIKVFDDKKRVYLSFENIEMLTTAFLNTAVGQLYKDYSESFIRANLEVADLSDSGKIALKRVVETAKLYYRDPDALGKSIDDIIGE